MTPRMYLLFHGRFPSEKAAAIFVAEAARAYASHTKVTVVAPRRRKRAGQVPKEVSVRYLPTLDLFGIPAVGGIAFLLSYSIFSLLSFFYLAFRAGRDDIVETNEWLPALLATFLSRNVVYEMHDFPEHFLPLYRVLFHRVRFVITTNVWKKKELSARFNLAAGKIILERNGVDIEQFAPHNMGEARKRLGLPPDARIALYTGHLYSWKGVDTLGEAAHLLPNVLIYFVGGTEYDVAQFKKKYGGVGNIRIIGSRPHDEVPLWQSAADVLVLPNTAKEEISLHYTSPMKLFEYMASERPIVASRIPSITEILDKDAGFFAEADDPKSFAEAIKNVITNANEAASRAARARTIVAKHSWERRARRLIDIF